MNEPACSYSTAKNTKVRAAEELTEDNEGNKDFETSFSLLAFVKRLSNKTLQRLLFIIVNFKHRIQLGDLKQFQHAFMRLQNF